MWYVHLSIVHILVLQCPSICNWYVYTSITITNWNIDLSQMFWLRWKLSSFGGCVAVYAYRCGWMRVDDVFQVLVFIGKFFHLISIIPAIWFGIADDVSNEHFPRIEYEFSVYWFLSQIVTIRQPNWKSVYIVFDIHIHWRPTDYITFSVHHFYFLVLLMVMWCV